MSQISKKKPGMVTAPEGMYDILPQDYALWDRLRKVVREYADYYNFYRIETPLLEKAELMERAFFEDEEAQNRFFEVTKGGERLIVRSDTTTSIIRAYVEHNLASLGHPLKIFYEGPVYLKDGFPEAPTRRQGQCAGFEIIDGDSDPIYDVQTILTSYRILEECKIKGLSISLNTLCCRHCRGSFKKQVSDYFRGKKASLCAQCEKDLPTTPFKLLTCESEKDKETRAGSPSPVEHLCVNCRAHFKIVFEYLEQLGLQYTLSPKLLGPCGYMTGTIFEIMAEGEPYPLATGGRHDHLVEAVGGKNIPAVGSVIYLDRLAHWITAKEVAFGRVKVKPKIFLIHIGHLARKKGLGLIEELREANINVWESLGKDVLNVQLKIASKMESPFALIFGQKEAFEDSIILRDMKTGMQETVPLKKIIDTLKKRI